MCTCKYFGRYITFEIELFNCTTHWMWCQNYSKRCKTRNSITHQKSMQKYAPKLCNRIAQQNCATKRGIRDQFCDRRFCIFFTWRIVMLSREKLHSELKVELKIKILAEREPCFSNKVHTSAERDICFSSSTFSSKTSWCSVCDFFTHDSWFASTDSRRCNLSRTLVKSWNVGKYCHDREYSAVKRSKVKKAIDVGRRLNTTGYGSRGRWKDLELDGAGYHNARWWVVRFECQ